MDDHSHDDLFDSSNGGIGNILNTLTPSGPPLLSPLSLASLSDVNEGAHGSNDEFDNEDDESGHGNDDAIEDYYGNDYEDEDSDDIITIHDLVNPGNPQTEQNSSGTASTIPHAEKATPREPKFGEDAKSGPKFCAFGLIEKYPQGDIKEPEKVAMWFRDNIFTAREWDLYCISNPYGKKDPILVVPTEQFERMIADAKSRLGLNLDIPTDPRSAFYTVFDGPILPRFVRTVHSETDLEDATQLLKLLKLENMVEDGCGKAVLAYGEKVKLIYNRLSHLTSKAEKKEKKRLKAVARQKGWGREMKRAQRYLGMRSKTAFGFDEQAPFATDDGLPLHNVHTPYPMESIVRLIAFDVEAYELSSDIITEIGLAILDTQSVLNSDPIETSRVDWNKLIETHHLRIVEHKSFVNKSWVKGCPEKFLFGTSEFVSLKDLSRRLLDLIRGDETFVLVGHDVGSDIKYFEDLGIQLRGLPGYHDEVDTRNIFRHAQRCNDGRALEFLCRELSVSPATHFHNAGNDAVYTMHCLLTMVLRKSAGEKITNSERDGWEPAGDPRDWSDGEEDDGGLPLALRT
ncbi:hypothetical protein E8E14_012440 [Neopestalotiopsis sp. 37M]|nr:hypothetical protein E8E14_012440 [Neopestalotiopsis sp. 37M]